MSSTHKKLPLFDVHYTLEGAVALLPEVKAALKTAWQDLNKIRDDIILYKRLHMAKKQQPMGTDGSEIDVLQKKYAYHDEKMREWVQFFEKKSLYVRDLDRGVVAFPYQAKSGDEFLLCWQYGEEGILSFFVPEDGHEARLPITVLPE